MEDIADLVLGAPMHEASALYHKLTKATHVRALQCGEWGPFRQVIAGLDIRCWDITARQQGQPLARLINNGARASVPAYASGIAIHQAPGMVSAAKRLGLKAFKVKVGFDLERDAKEVVTLAGSLMQGERLFTDANQAWTVDEAIRFIDLAEQAGIGWLEEPILADAPAGDWARLKSRGGIPLAAGENIVGLADYSAVIKSRVLTYVQPDVAKWGGITDCAVVARQVISAGLTYCPHFLGAGIGLIASAHLLAAVGGDGLLEVDINPNILRDAIAPMSTHLSDGQWLIGTGVGLGIDRLPPELDQFRTLHLERRR